MAYLQVPFDCTLNTHRQSSSVNNLELRKFLFSEECIKIEREIIKEMQNFAVLNLHRDFELTQEEQKCLSVKKVVALSCVKLKLKDLENQPTYSFASLKTIDQSNKCASIQTGISFGMFPASLLYLGSERHIQLYNDVCSRKISGAFCLTEVGHGSDTKNMRTTATYDKYAKEFVLHTPNFQAAKCWAGNIGKLATHAIVYAQLITSERNSHGLHSFVVPLRDTKTMLPFPGVTIVDFGEKIGLTGIDNGLVLFNRYRIPKTYLLNKLADVTDDGKYLLNVEDANQIYTNSFKVLSDGRLSIMSIGNITQIHALTIGVRYAAVKTRLDTKNVNDEQNLDLNRLIPHVATCYTTLMFLNHFYINKNDSKLQDRECRMELHAILSAGKPYFTFITQIIIRDCKEACSDLGLLCVSDIGNIKNNHDATVTYEGDNNVLMEQTSNWLLRFWPLIESNKPIISPLGSCDFLNGALNILQSKFKFVTAVEFYEPENICTYYQWLVCYLLKISYQKCNTSENDGFWTKSNAQIFHLKNLSVVYLENLVLKTAYGMAQNSRNLSTKNVLGKLISLYGVWSLQKHITFFYEGFYADTPLFAKLIEESIFLLSEDFKNDLVPLVDAISLSDEIITSILGNSDGQVYSKLFQAILKTNGAFSNLKLPNLNKSKL